MSFCVECGAVAAFTGEEEWDDGDRIDTYRCTNDKCDNTGNVWVRNERR